jgi:arsenical resistance protein ArsH
MATTPPPTKVVISNGDLNNKGAMRASKRIEVDPVFSHCTLAPTAEVDDKEVRDRYRPFILDPVIESTDWVSCLELATVTKLASENLLKTGDALRVLVVYGSLRSR